jgi:hypothetical protein
MCFPKHWYLPTSLHDVTTQKNSIVTLAKNLSTETDNFALIKTVQKSFGISEDTEIQTNTQAV